MMSARLSSPAEAETVIAKLLRDEYAKTGGKCSIWVRDDSAFQKPGSLCLGFFRFPLTNIEFGNLTGIDAWTEIVRLGAFEWHVSAISDVERALHDLLGYNREEVDPLLGRLLPDISSIAVRTGLLQPTFDSAALDEMPYRRATTIIADTSGVLQGGLDFIARHLYPSSRIKIPAIVNMELVNSSDNFFKIRRETKLKTASQRRRELAEHLKSQGGQRALLRLELQTDTEIERTFLFGDPLREAFSTDRSKEVSGLNVSLPIRSYVDRLILEAARLHQAHSGPGHDIRLLTGDQGQARMAMAEGVSPLYFENIGTGRFFGACVTGRVFEPFSGAVRGISLASVLWEFATAFGSACLKCQENGTLFSVAALGKDMPWSPYHSLEDLLWCTSTVPANGAAERANKPDDTKREGPAKRVGIRAKSRGREQAVNDSKRATYFRFDVGKLVRLVCTLDDRQEMDEAAVTEIVQTGHVRGRDEYRRFLLSGSFIVESQGMWVSQRQLVSLSGALRNENVLAVRELLLKAPSFRDFAELVRSKEIGQPLGSAFTGRHTSTYRILGEITQLCAEVRGKGIFPTLHTPEAEEFSRIAVKRFQELDDGDGLVATGAWLEELILRDGIHPEIARLRLEEASQRRMLRRSTEGSTMQMRNRTHVVHVLRALSRVPEVLRVHLYRGDFLIPGKSSASLRVEAMEQ